MFPVISKKKQKSISKNYNTIKYIILQHRRNLHYSASQ